MDLYGVIFLFAVIILRLLPGFVTVLISLGTKHTTQDRKTRTAHLLTAGISIFLNLLVYAVIHRFLRGSWNFLHTAKAVYGFDFTYQQLDYLPISFLLCLSAAFLLGMLLRLLFRKAFQKKLYYRPVSGGRKAGIFSILAAMGIAIILLFYISFSGTQNIVINEVGSYNLSLSVNETGLVCDYIELYNSGQLDCELRGLCLTDDISDLAKKAVPNGILPAKSHLLIPLNDNTLSVRKEGNETVTLSDSAGNILDQVTTRAVGADLSYCRTEDGGPSWAQATGTPGVANSSGTVRLESPPVFSHESGFYNEGFDLHMDAGEGCTVYYTLDGSIPTAESSVYSQPISVYDKSSEPNVFRSIQNVRTNWASYSPDTTPVDKAFIVRAIAISEDGAVSEPVTATYFIDLESYKAKNTVSLIVDPDDMWGDNGIYVTGKAYDEWYKNGSVGDAPTPNFEMHGREYEIEATLSYFSQTLSFDQKIGLRINGASARNNILKRFSLYARNEYSGNRFFNGNPIGNFSSRKLLLRNGTANAVCQAIAAGRNVAIQRYTPVTVFLNGEYWYETNLMEKYDDNYFLQHYRIAPDNIIVCDRYGISEGVESDSTYWGDVYGYLKTHNMADPENYAELNRILDLQSYIDFMCINIYIDNMDFDDYKNVVAWKVRTPGLGEYSDGRWRLALYDLDAMEWNDAAYWGVASQAQKNTFALKPRFSGAINQQHLFSQLKTNDLFRQQFVTTFMDLVNNEFAYENVEEVFCTYNGAAPETYYADFFRDRAQFIVPYMAEEFQLSGTLETLSLLTNDPSGGYIQLNTITPDLTGGNWTGQYYTDYPITVTAIANSGYEFVGWEGSENTKEAELEVSLKEGGITLNAIFKKIEKS